MVLDHEELLEAKAIGFDHIVDEAFVSLAVFEADAALGPCTAEQTELHALFLRGRTLEQIAERWNAHDLSLMTSSPVIRGRTMMSVPP
jgi:hypothetical protein